MSYSNNPYGDPYQPNRPRPNQPSYPQPPGQPYDPYGDYPPPTAPWPVPPQPAQPQPGPYGPGPRGRRPRRRSRRSSCGCIPFFLLLGFLALCLSVYLLAPIRTNILFLGIDYTDPGSFVGRSDTMIMMTFEPLRPYIGMLSLPRDLWVALPDGSENRINTAHFFAEASQRGSGPDAAMGTVRSNLGVDVDYYVRIRFEGVREIINALGGVDLNLPEPMAGYEAGPVHLNGNKALAFARHRSGSDDFFRMQHGQILVKGVFQKVLNPLNWWRMPQVMLALIRAIDTDVPIWTWPRLGLAALRLGPEGIDNRTVSREMVVPFTTTEGAQVLAPDWVRINPILKEMFGQ